MEKVLVEIKVTTARSFSWLLQFVAKLRNYGLREVLCPGEGACPSQHAQLKVARPEIY